MLYLMLYQHMLSHFEILMSPHESNESSYQVTLDALISIISIKTTIKLSITNLYIVVKITFLSLKICVFSLN